MKKKIKPSFNFLDQLKALKEKNTISQEDLSSTSFSIDAPEVLPMDTSTIALPPVVDTPTIPTDGVAGLDPLATPINLKEVTPGITEEQSNSLLQTVISIESPYDFLCFFDDEVNSGRVTLYPWQLEILEEFIEQPFTKEHPYEGCKVCCNGSGKDKYIIATFAVWFLCTKKRSRCIITTASGNQLTTQTEPYIRQLCQKVNSFLGREYITIKQRHMSIKETNPKTGMQEDGSEICLFATDEGYKAEGYHPWDDGCEMALIVNEAKGVLPEIFEALERCTGYNYNLMISSPGPCFGNFYNYYLSGLSKTHKITAYMCPHIPKDSIEKTKKLYGVESALFRSKILAEFTNVQGMTVIGEDDYQACLGNKEFKVQKGERFAGLDTSKGGDETSLSIWEGNIEIGKENFQSRDITIQAQVLAKLFEKWGLKGHNINSDDGGISGGINDILHRMGWFVNRVVNQSQAQDTSAFQNRGAELYFNFNRLIQEKLIMPQKDEVTRRQLVGRKYKKSEALGKICLQSKKEAKAEGQHSPDRGDAVVLAFAGKNIYTFLATGSLTNTSSRQSTSAIISSSTTDRAKASSAQGLRIIDGPTYDPYANYEAQLKSNTSSSRSFGSISRILHN